MPEIALAPEQASTGAVQVDLLFFFVSALCGAVGLMVAFLLIYFSVRYRHRPEQSGPPAETPSNHKLEWFWTITPMFLFAVMFVWGAEVYMNVYRAPDEAKPVYVVAKQWMWKLQHPEGQREINQLHVPVGRPVKLLLTSEDVIHSFFVPAFRIHMDVLPERYTSVWFQATRAGRYHLFCSQYCGANHASMIGEVVALDPAEYQEWLQNSAEGSLALEGRKIFLKHRCISCHSADASARAPVLEALYRKPVHLDDGRTVIADEDYLRESILHASAKIVAGYKDIMPEFSGLITEEEVIDLIDFIKSLPVGGTPSRVEDFPPPVRSKGKNSYPPAAKLPGAEVPEP